MNEQTDFINASDIPLTDQKILDEYYYVKLQLRKLEEKEHQLKEGIKNMMLNSNIKNINTQNMFLSCHKVERILYPKEKIETFVPKDILDKIRTVSESIVLTAKLK